jgi:hypothetical protein
MKKTLIGFLSCIALLGSVLLYTACDRKKESIGPNYFVAPAGFNVVSFDIPDKDMNFVTEKCTINAEFSHKVSWTMVLKGSKSGATRTYSGATNTISYETALWNGGHDGLYFFEANERVDLELTFFGSDIKVKDTIRVTTPRDFSQNTNNFFLVAGIGNGYEASANNAVISAFPGRFTFLSTGPCPGTHRVKVDSDIASEDAELDGMKAVEGTKVFFIRSKSCQSDGFFIGGMQHRRTGFFFPTWTDPTKVYFNLFVYGTGDANAKLNLEFHEADAANDVNKPQTCGADNIPVGQHSPCTDDGYVYQADISHTGWKMISVKYSDMPKSASPTNGGSGDGVKEPNRVHRIQIGLISNPSGNEVTAIWDFPVITYGAPFDPTL